MKKSVILSILGLAAATVASYGQGAIEFNTYLANNSIGILASYGATGNGGVAGAGINSTFTGELVWSATNPGDAATSSAASAALPLNGLLNLPGTGGSGGTGTFDSGSASVPGFIAGSNLNVTAAVGTSLYFEIVAFSGASYGEAGFWSGHSASFTGTLVTGTTLPDPSQINNMAPFSVYFVPTATPEPTTMALGGLGLAALLVARRKKA
jgi:hypothetical protein